MELNILVRGQSNAQIIMDAEGGFGQQLLRRRVEELLGFDGVNDSVKLIYGHSAPDMATVASGTALMTDWLNPVGGDWRNGWQTGAQEVALLRFIEAQPADIRDNPTAVLWLHNEYDAIRSDVTAEMWASAVQYDAALVRQALGQGADRVPYVFVSAIPSSSAVDHSLQSIRLAMEALANDKAFNGAIGARALDLDMSWDDLDGRPETLEYGGTHISSSDAWLVLERVARSIAEGWSEHALPGSAVARGNGDIPNQGPEAIAARRAGGNLLEVDFAFDNASTLVAQPIVGTGLGWSIIHASGRVISATGLAPVDHDTVLLEFAEALPEGPLRLHYGWGYGRLADGSGRAQGNAIYDEFGLPAWTMAQGVGVIGWQDGRGILDYSDVALRPMMAYGLTTEMMSRADEARFLDGRMVFDHDDPSAQALRLYQSAFARESDIVGLNFWTDALKSGWSLTQVSGHFLDSAEFQTRYGSLANHAFVDNLYWNVLGRGPDQGGSTYWVSQLDGGMGRDRTLELFSESKENRDLTAWQVDRGIWIGDALAIELARLYSAALGRKPDAGGLAHYLTAIEAGANMSDVAADFLRSPEFAARYAAPSNADFVVALYGNTLGRAPDESGFASWVAALDAGLSRVDAVLAFSGSAEHTLLTQQWVLGTSQDGYGITFV